MDIQEVFSTYDKELTAVEDFLGEKYDSYVQLIPEISNHIINSGGKRLRPLLLMISSDLCGYRGERRYALAATIEFIHTASLLHDDVIDHANIRRGKMAANRLWGNTASILVGDYLYATAFRLLTEDGDSAVQQLVATATTTMVEGETLQFLKSGDVTITEEEYLAIIEKKTAILMSTACAMGAVLARAPEPTVSALYQFGMLIGTTFQVTDDTLDYVGAEENFGKTIGMDLREGKMTLPLIHILKQCSDSERASVSRIIESKSAADDDILEISSIISKYEGIEYAIKKAKESVKEAKRLIASFEDSIPKQALLTISDYILQRKL